MKNLVGSIELTNYEFEVLYAGLLLGRSRHSSVALMETWFALRDKGLVRITKYPRPARIIPWSLPTRQYDIFVTDLGLEVINKAPVLIKFIVAGKYDCWSRAYSLVHQLSKEELPTALVSECIEVREFAQQRMDSVLE